ncbi:MAG: esterase/lipase family protein [Woeseiaceae bacterium]
MNSIDTVVCTHGIWWHGVGMYLIKRHLEREFGMRALIFSYPSVTNTLDENAELLARFIADNEVSETHIVGHSLGGLVALRMLAQGFSDVPGRVVCLGSPLSGSRAAEILHAKDWGEHLLGHSVPEGTIYSVANDWAGPVCGHRDVGVIAGNIPVGIGHITGTFGEPNDGTVAISETQLDGARDHLVMPVTHMGLTTSRNVADQIGSFLRRGEFLRELD